MNNDVNLVDVPNLVYGNKQVPKVCGCYSICFSCFSTSTNWIYTMKFLLHWQVNYEASANIKPKIRPS